MTAEAPRTKPNYSNQLPISTPAFFREAIRIGQVNPWLGQELRRIDSPGSAQSDPGDQKISEAYPMATKGMLRIEVTGINF